MDGIYLLLGSNLDKKDKNLEDAIILLEASEIKIRRKTAVYQSAAWGITEQPIFLNQVLEVETTLSPEALLANILDIESAMGRIRKIKWGERLIDIDILYYHDQAIKTKSLTIPHPQIQHRKFTLVPLCELIPEHLHPTLQQTQKALLEATDDLLEVLKVE